MLLGLSGNFLKNFLQFLQISLKIIDLLLGVLPLMANFPLALIESLFQFWQ